MHLPKSSFGRMAPTAHLSDGSLLIALKSYFDQSGKEDAARMTLGAVAASDAVWGDLEQDWTGFLAQHKPPARYMHMIEAVHLRGEYSKEKGWDDDKVFGVINSLLSLLTGVSKTGYCNFVCTVDMNAYRKLQAESYQMEPPAEICLVTCVVGMFEWYLREYKGFDVDAHYYFDVGEPFEPILKAKWERELEASALTNAYSFWSHIKHIGPAQMRSTPGLQVADMLAWATNRELHDFGPVLTRQRYQELIIPLRSLIPTKYVTWDEWKLRQTFKPLIYRPYEQKPF